MEIVSLSQKHKQTEIFVRTAQQWKSIFAIVFRWSKQQGESLPFEESSVYTSATRGAFHLHISERSCLASRKSWILTHTFNLNSKSLPVPSKSD